MKTACLIRQERDAEKRLRRRSSARKFRKYFGPVVAMLFVLIAFVLVVRLSRRQTDFWAEPGRTGQHCNDEMMFGNFTSTAR
jgi:hypothetical protein